MPDEHYLQKIKNMSVERYKANIYSSKMLLKILLGLCCIVVKCRVVTLYGKATQKTMFRVQDHNALIRCPRPFSASRSIVQFEHDRVQKVELP